MKLIILGQIRNKTNGHILSWRKNKEYFSVAISVNKKAIYKLIHRLVAEAFIPNPNNFPEINHMDGNKENNCVENLEWCTRSQNLKHAYDNNLRYPKMGVDHPNSKYKTDQIKLICILLKYHIHINLIKILSNVNNTTIHDIRHGKAWKHISSHYNIEHHQYYKSKKIKYKKLKEILIDFNIFDKIDLSELLYSKYIIKKRKLVEDMEKLGY